MWSYLCDRLKHKSHATLSMHVSRLLTVEKERDLWKYHWEETAQSKHRLDTSPSSYQCWDQIIRQRTMIWHCTCILSQSLKADSKDVNAIAHQRDGCIPLAYTIIQVSYYSTQLPNSDFWNPWVTLKGLESGGTKHNTLRSWFLLKLLKSYFLWQSSFNNRL